MTGYVLTLVSTHEGLDEASYQNIMGKSGGGGARDTNWCEQVAQTPLSTGPFCGIVLMSER